MKIYVYCFAVSRANDSPYRITLLFGVSTMVFYHAPEKDERHSHARYAEIDRCREERRRKGKQAYLHEEASEKVRSDSHAMISPIVGTHPDRKHSNAL
jgi:hypothetical protein